MDCVFVILTSVGSDVCGLSVFVVCLFVVCVVEFVVMVISTLVCFVVCVSEGSCLFLSFVHPAGAGCEEWSL